MRKDFNSIFWEIWGVNNRVYEIFDIFSVKSHNLDDNEIKKYKNLNRDKQADFESYDNFLRNEESLSNEKFFEHLEREPHLFYIFFIDYLLGDSEQVRFYINQLNNIVINYRIFEREKLKQEKFINVFAFQIAYIIEDMNYNGLSIDNFEKMHLYLNVVSENKFVFYLSNWKKNKELPTFLNLLTIINTIKKGTNVKCVIFFHN